MSCIMNKKGISLEIWDSFICGSVKFSWQYCNSNLPQLSRVWINTLVPWCAGFYCWLFALKLNFNANFNVLLRYKWAQMIHNVEVSFW